MTAWLRHGPFAMWLVRAARPKTIIELGAHYGYSYFAFCQAVKDAGLPTRCIAVDTWQGEEHSGLYGEEVFDTVRSVNRHYEEFSTLLRKTFTEALDYVEDGSVDLLHVDGRHFYDDVKEDYESWIPKLSDRAVILFHDTEVRERGFGVWRYWEELAQAHPMFNFHYQHGLGVLFRGGDLSPEMAAFRRLVQDDAGREAVTALFQAQGDALAADHTLEELAGKATESTAALSELLTSLESGQLAPESQLCSPGSGGAAIAAALSKATAKIETLAAERNRFLANRDDTQARVLDLQSQNMTLREELARARGNVFMVWKEGLAHRVLTGLISSRLPVSEKVRARLARSAHKRDPNRSLITNNQSGPVTKNPQLASSDGLQTLQGRVARDPERGNVLVVTHDASFTGAPILAQNMMRVLAERYNVYAVTIRGGELISPILDCTVETVIAGRPPKRGRDGYGQIRRFLSERDLDFAVVNSIESRRLLPILRGLDVASVSLIHEFASYTRPKQAYREAVDQSDEVIFSSQLTLDNAADEAPIELSPHIHVFPQGKCVVPGTATEADEHERLRLEAHLRPPGHEDDFLVIGAGYVHIRKGVDLFIEVARHARARAKGRALRFVWIGDGYDPEADMALGAFLRDQLKRSGVEDIVHFMSATPEIEQAYEMADLLMLPSRLDPLPNVAIDAMLTGTPVLCFENATGIADVLNENGIGDACVAEYMNTSDMAEKLLTLASSPELYADIATRTRSHAEKVFDMHGYVERVEALALAARARKRSKAEDAELIAAEIQFDPAYTIPAHHELSSKWSNAKRTEVASAYLDNLSRPNWARRPEPGFNPHIYARHMRDRDGNIVRNPYADFLARGRPDGPWLLPVIYGTGDIKLSEAAAAQRVALHVHAYYTDMMADILDKLQHNQSRPDLHVTVNSPDGQAQIQRVLTRYEGAYFVHLVPNIGRDIGPFLTSVGPQLLRDYDIVGHVHTKKSIGVAKSALIENWTRFLYENTLGGAVAGAMTDRILNSFAAKPELGIVFPADPNVLNWARNRQPATVLAEKMGVTSLPEAFDFPVGTMFWARATAMRPFIDLGLTGKDYPGEPVGTDGTTLHALERLFGIVPVVQGYGAAVTVTPGLTR